MQLELEFKGLNNIYGDQTADAYRIRDIYHLVGKESITDNSVKEIKDLLEQRAWFIQGLFLNPFQNKQTKNA